MAEYKIHNRMTHWQKSYPTWISFAAIALLLAVWEIVCSSGLISSLFLPAPSAILAALGKLIAGGEISRSLAASLYRILLGFALGSIIGLLVGLVTGTSALMDRIGTPIVNALYPIPKIALLPLFILFIALADKDLRHLFHDLAVSDDLLVRACDADDAHGTAPVCDGQVQPRPHGRRGILRTDVQLRQALLYNAFCPCVEVAHPCAVRAGNDISPFVHHVDVLPHDAADLVHDTLGALY